jgi:hypothetical protein
MGVHHRPEPDEDGEDGGLRQLVVAVAVVVGLLLLLAGCCIGCAHVAGGAALHVFDN